LHNSDGEPDAIAEARLFLGAGAEHLDVDDLLARLLDYRNGTHPDKFTDEDAKRDASTQFKRVQELIDKLDGRRQRQLIRTSQRSLVISEDSSRELTHRLQLNASDRKIDGLKNEVEELRRTNRDLAEKLKADREADRTLELEKLRKMYEPSRSRLVGVAATVLLGTILAGLSQVDQIAVMLKQYSPLAPSTFNIGIFSICIAALVVTGFKYVKHLEYQHMLRQVCTTTFATGFLSFSRNHRDDFERQYGRSFLREFCPDPNDAYHLSEFEMWMHKHKDQLSNIDDEDFQKQMDATRAICSRFVHQFEPRRGDESFDEHTVLQYLDQYYRSLESGSNSTPTHWVRHLKSLFSARKLRTVYRMLLGLFSNEANDHLKDAFILHLIDRELVDDPKVGGFVHRFRIR